MKKKVALILTLCLVMTSVLAGCSGGGEKGKSEGSSDDVIKIGAIYPTTGNYALLGNESLKGLQLAVKEWNEKGGINGMQIKLVVTDAPDTTAAQTEAERLINKEGIKILTGAYSSALANVISDVCARYEVPYFELGGIAADIMQKDYKYLWRTCSDTNAFSLTAVEFLDQGCLPKMNVDRKDAKIAIPHEDSNYGTNIAEAELERLLKLGYKKENVKIVPYNAASVDLSTVILDIKAFKPDGVLATSYANDSVLFARQAKELGLEIPVLIGAGGGHSLASTYEALGNDIYGIYTSDFPQYRSNMEGDTKLADYMEFYKATYKQEPLSGHSLTNYNGGTMMLKIIEAAEGSLDKDVIHEAAYSMDEPLGTYAGGWGCKFGTTGQNENAPTTVSMWTPNTLDTVWPSELSISDFVAPMPTWVEKSNMTF